MEQKGSVERDLGKGSVGKLLFSMALPAIIAQLINVLYNIVDRMYIGHIPGNGPAALTGLGVTMPIITSISAFAALVSMGAAPRASIMLGRKEPENAQKILGNCTALLIMLAIVLTVIFQLFGRPILQLFGASDNTLGFAWDYMQIYTMGTIFVQLSLGLNAFITAQGYSKISMFTVMIGAICNIILDPLFIFVFNMGVQGAALATILSQSVSCIWVLRFLTSKKSFLRIQKKNMIIQLNVILPCLALGLAPFIMQITESILTISFNTSLLRYGGDVAVGAMTILASTMQFAMLPIQGLTQGGTPIISYNFGAGNLDRVKKTFWLLLKTCVIYGFSFWLLVQLFPQMFIGIFTSDQALMEYGTWAIRIYMAATLIFGIQISCQQTFIALGNAKTSLFLALLRKVILLIPLIFILPNFFENKPFAVFLAEPVADTLAVTTTATMFYISFKKLMNQGVKNTV